jgi:predicted dienelactone hydrolase
MLTIGVAATLAPGAAAQLAYEVPSTIAQSGQVLLFQASVTPPHMPEGLPEKVQWCEADWVQVGHGHSMHVHVFLPDGHDRMPAVIYSHGLGGSVSSGMRWTRAWMDAGIAVVHIVHNGSDAAIAQGLSPAARSATLKAAANAEQLIERTQDVSEVITRINQRGWVKACDLGRIDTRRIGMAGHSFGAATTQALAGQLFPSSRGLISLADPRIVAGIAISPAVPRGGHGLPDNPEAAARVAFGKIQVPLLSVTGTRDLSQFNPRLAATDREHLFAALPPGKAYLLVLGGATHADLSGCVSEAAVCQDMDGINATFEKVTTLFWKAMLLGDPGAAAMLMAPPPGLVRPVDIYAVR